MVNTYDSNANLLTTTDPAWLYDRQTSMIQEDLHQCDGRGWQCHVLHL